MPKLDFAALANFPLTISADTNQLAQPVNIKQDQVSLLRGLA